MEFLALRRTVVGAVVLPHPPYDPRDSIRQGDRRLVVTARTFSLERPDPQPIAIGLGFLRMTQDGSGPVNQQRAQVGITALADPTKSPSETAGRLARSEPEVAGEVA